MKSGKEIWKDIPNYEGLYQVSNLGRVRSKERILTLKNDQKRKYKSKIISQWHNRQGYLEVTLWKYGERKNFRVNRLVAEMFLINPLGLPEVNHKDEHKENNAFWNLEYMSHYSNIQYSRQLHKDDPNYGRRKKYKCQNQLTA